jgi:hypothetical protein
MQSSDRCAPRKIANLPPPPQAFAAAPRYIASARTAQKISLRTVFHCCVRTLPSNGRCHVACFAVAALQQVYMSQCNPLTYA